MTHKHALLTPDAAPEVVAAHEEKRTLVEEVFIPAHMPRTATAAYRAIHHELVVVQDRPCLACGVRNSTLHDPAHNPHGATAIETHHHILEWSLAGCADLAKFNRRVVAHFRAQGTPGYETDFDQQQMLDWIDHSPQNLWPLCSVCHRGKFRGIHAITAPLWSALDLVQDGYRLVPAAPVVPDPAAQVPPAPASPEEH